MKKLERVYCTAFFKAKQGQEEKLYQALKSLEEETHKEKGCVMYKVMRNIENPFAQGKIGKEYTILFDEIWETEEDFNNHNQSPHIQNFFQKECLDENGSAESWDVNLFQIK